MSHPHSESGITDEAAMEGHDLIHNAEVEEQKVEFPRPASVQLSFNSLLGMIDDNDENDDDERTESIAAHGREALTQPDYGEEQEAGKPSSSEQKQKSQKHDKSTMEKVKEALHMKK